VGREDEAYAEWEAALAQAEKFKDRELLSVSKIHFARGRLISGKQSARAVLDEVSREAGNIKSDKLFVAFSWYVRGLALRELGSFREAEDAIKQSLDIHEKGKYQLRAAYDWYLIASIRSKAGNTDGALQALNSAITLDRRMENSWGLAADWRAMGDVYRKTGKNKEAEEAYNRAKAIFLALGNKQDAEEIDKRMEKY
jgi:tetratricopeptide (TPR) repeat protein